MMFSMVENFKVTLVFSVEPDGDGWLVCEQDGSGRAMKWGPMPLSMIQPFIAERRQAIQATIEHELERITGDVRKCPVDLRGHIG